MEHSPEQRERMVWERVFAGREQKQTEDLRVLYDQARQEAEDFRILAERLSGKRRELAERLRDEAREKVWVLGGLVLAGGAVPDRGKLPTRERRERLSGMIRRCYYRACRNCAEYNLRLAQSEDGTVFKVLAHREEQRCLQIARLLWEASSTE